MTFFSTSSTDHFDEEQNSAAENELSCFALQCIVIYRAVFLYLRHPIIIIAKGVPFVADTSLKEFDDVQICVQTRSKCKFFGRVHDIRSIKKKTHIFQNITR